MGHMDVIAIISDGFNVYFPMAILAFCLATYFSVGSRILSMLGFHQFVGDDEITTDLVDEGRELIKREKRRRQRAEESMTRRREFQERFAPEGQLATRGRNSEITRSENNRLRDRDAGASYEGTRIDAADITAAFPQDDDIDARFGASTRYVSSRELEPRFSDSYQHEDGYRGRVGMPPRGIFDDV